jgi:hypothetical protein
MAESAAITFNIRADLAKKLRDAADRKKTRFAPTMTAIMERGLELALEELAKRDAKA